MPQLPQLPNELVCSIIEELYDDDDPRACIWLRNCALVARAWVHASQRRIFRSILFDRSFEHLGRLISVFDANPRLANYVKHLSITIYRYSERYEESVAVLTSIANHISELDEISFCHFNWDKIPSVLQEHFLRFLRSPSLSRATFWNIHFNHLTDFASLFSNLTHPKALEINDMHCSDWNMSGRDENDTTIVRSLPPPRSIQLVDLKLGDTVRGHLLFWLDQDSCPFDIGNLRALRFYNDGSRSYPGRTAWIIHRAGESLRELEIQGLQSNQHSMGAVHIGYTRNLHHLKLNGFQQTPSLTPVPLIESLLKPVISSNQCHPLQTLTIYLCAYQHTFDDNPLYTHDWGRWKVIDKILEHKVFSALEEVSIHFCFASFIMDRTMKVEEVEKLVHKVLPFLSESGKLRYKFKNTR